MFFNSLNIPPTQVLGKYKNIFKREHQAVSNKRKIYSKFEPESHLLRISGKKQYPSPLSMIKTA